MNSTSPFDQDRAKSARPVGMQTDCFREVIAWRTTVIEQGEYKDGTLLYIVRGEVMSA